jgi:hypothetical protein
MTLTCAAATGWPVAASVTRPVIDPWPCADADDGHAANINASTASAGHRERWSLSMNTSLGLL